ncbi:carbohydrate kinase family protein [Actinomycetaceae bacterium L2_0104]
MTAFDVVCVGSSVVDIPLQPVDRSVFDAVSYPVNDISMRAGGDALNESIVLSRLGAKVALVTAVGADAAGDFIVESARSEAVDVGGIRVNERLTTSLNVGLVQPDGERTFITNRNGSLWKTEESDIDAANHLDGRILAFGSIFNNPLLSGEWLAGLFAQARRAGMTVCADMVPSRIGAGLEDIAEALSYVDYFFPNAQEAVALTGARDESEAADILLGKGVGTVVLKVGKRGCLVRGNEVDAVVPAFVRDDLEAIDTTGAGDNFAAGFIRALLDGKSAQECAVFANAVAAVSVGGLGATEGVRSKAQVDEFIASNKRK